MSIKPNNRFLIALMPVFLLAVVVFSSCFAGCPGKQATADNTPVETGEDVTVYFTKSRGTNTVTEGVVRHLPESPAQEQAPESNAYALQYAVSQLLSGPTENESVQGFYSEIPKGTRLLGVKEENGTLTVNLSKQFTSGGGSNSIRQRMAELTQTVLSVAKNQPVLIEVEGQKLETAGGEGLEIEQPITNNPG